ncbi:hypothetical protein PRIPAC_81596 [Pristionchus pacificus]|uniref:Fatty-acid and retinol-binding protein 1 n=1 Tax=Pristionchus pacificus TaxID=54126 RepID=A0A2A6BXS7_PRIPA|nr:hypothetical protein PRIPAC_81596 [Pristionchus pacificus]|eukprot:PDM70734.1 hypothetical protein PRIPAC_44938 [Pristionchus pacificus]
MILTLILLLFSPRETEVVNHDIWSKITMKLTAMADFPVNTRAAAETIIYRALNMSIAPQEYFDNCKASWVAIALTSDKMALMISSFGSSWPLTYAILQAKKPEFDIMFAKMNKNSLDFIRNTIQDLLELIVSSSKLVYGESDYPLVGRFVKKTSTKYKKLPVSSIRSMEIATCWYSHLMMRDEKNGLWHILASSIPYAHLSHAHRNEL